MMSLLKFMINFETWTFYEQHLLIYRKRTLNIRFLLVMESGGFNHDPPKGTAFLVRTRFLIPNQLTNFSHTVLQLAGVTDRLDVPLQFPPREAGEPDFVSSIFRTGLPQT